MNHGAQPNTTRYIEGLPFRATVCYAYSPRENVGSRGATHAICIDDLDAGRLHRKAGEALCTTRRFWGLAYREPERGVSCKACQRIMAQFIGEEIQA